MPEEQVQNEQLTRMLRQALQPLNDTNRMAVKQGRQELQKFLLNRGREPIDMSHSKLVVLQSARALLRGDYDGDAPEIDIICFSMGDIAQKGEVPLTPVTLYDPANKGVLFDAQKKRLETIMTNARPTAVDVRLAALRNTPLVDLTKETPDNIHPGQWQKTTQTVFETLGILPYPDVNILANRINDNKPSGAAVTWKMEPTGEVTLWA